MITRRRVFTRFSLIVAVVFGSSVLLVSTDWTKLSLHDADAARRDSEVIGVTVDRRVNATPNASCREPTLTYPPYKSPQGQTRPASYESLLCESKHFYDDEDVQSLRTQSKSEPSSEKFNIFIFPVESLTMQAFHSDMPKTRNVLEGAGAVFFANFHHRSGNTRANLVPMLLGELVDYRLVSEQNNITCVFNLTEESLLERSLWHIASKHEYATVQGGTACNAFVGCNRLSTSDGYIFHDNLKQRTDFDYSFPYGAFYASHQAERCTNYVEAKTVEDVLRCASEGPYSEKFLNYYEKLRKKNEGVLTFTVTQLEEPHGNKMYWPVDAIVADFLKWIIDEDDTLLVFLGDHGDASGTPLAIVPPSSVDVAFDPLRYLASSMIVHDNIYDFLQRYLRSGDISESIRLLAETLQTNHSKMSRRDKNVGLVIGSVGHHRWILRELFHEGHEFVIVQWIIIWALSRTVRTSSLIRIHPFRSVGMIQDRHHACRGVHIDVANAQLGKSTVLNNFRTINIHSIENTARYDWKDCFRLR